MTSVGTSNDASSARKSLAAGSPAVSSSTLSGVATICRVTQSASPAGYPALAEERRGIVRAPLRHVVLELVGARRRDRGVEPVRVVGRPREHRQGGGDEDCPRYAAVAVARHVPDDVA